MARRISESDIAQGRTITDADIAPSEPSFVDRVVIPNALRIGGAVVGGVAGGMAATPTVLGVPAGVWVGGGLGAGAGETAAEAYEVRTGQRSRLNPTQIATQTALGAIPVAGKAPGAAATAEEVAKYAARLPLRRALQGAAFGGGASVATQLAETGELPSGRTVADQAVVGGLLGAVGGKLEARPQSKRAFALRAAESRPKLALPPGPDFIANEAGDVGRLGQPLPEQPDPSFVRAERGEWPEKEPAPVRGYLPAAGESSARRTIAIGEDGIGEILEPGASPTARPIGGSRTPAAAVATEAKPRVEEAAIAGREFEGKKVTRTIFSSDIDATDAPLVQLSDPERRELRRMLEEMNTFTYNKKTWTEAPRKSGNAAGGDLDVTAGSAWAPVFRDITGNYRTRPSGAKVTQAISDMLEGKHSALGQEALDVAQLRLQGDRSVSKPSLPPNWDEAPKVVHDDVPFDVDESVPERENRPAFSDADRLALQRSAEVPSISEDWGSRERGSGKRVGRSVRGGMSDPPTGVRQYSDFERARGMTPELWSEIRLLEDEDKRVAIGALQQGYSTDDALRIAYGADPLGEPAGVRRSREPGEEGFVTTGLLTRGAGAGVGAAYGAATGEDNQDRAERAALFGAAGAALPSLLREEPPSLLRGKVRKAPAIQPIGELSSVPRAGAIRPEDRMQFRSLEKMPEEIRGDIQAMLEQHGGFETQRRGVQPMARTEARSERVAIPLETLKPGTALNAEELAAYKNAVASTMSERLPLAQKIAAGTASDAEKLKFSELTDRATVLVSSYRGAKAEAGRALNILRSKARVLEYGDTRFIEQLVRQPGNDEQLKQAALLAAEAGNDPIKQLEVLRRAAKPTMMQLFQATYYNGLLSGVKTHLRNSLGNSFNVLANLTTPLGAAPADAIRSKMTGNDRTVFLGEIPHALAGTITALPQAFRDALFSLQHGFTPKAVAKAAGGEFDVPRVEVPGGMLTNWPSRALEAADTFFRTLGYEQELRGGAYAIARQRSSDPNVIASTMADLIATPPPSLRQRAEAFAARSVFQEKPGPTLQHVIAATKGSQAPAALRLGMTFVTPFIRTPANVLRQGLEFSPAGFAMKAARAEGREGSQALGRAALGSLVAAPIAYLAATNQLSGNGPTDRTERAALMESGWRPNSVKVGNQWVQYQLLQPLSVQLAAIANAWERFKDGPTTDQAAEEHAMEAIAGASASLLDQSFLAGLNGLLDAIQDPERNAERFFEQFAQGLVPASGLMRNVTQAVDPVVRDPRGTIESVEAIVPGLSKKVPARVDRFGREVERPGGPIERGFLVPGRSPETHDPVNALLAKLDITPDLPRASLGDLGTRMSRADELALRQAIGQERYARLQRFAVPEFDRLPPEQQRSLVENELRTATSTINARAKALLARGESLATGLLTKAQPAPKPQIMAALSSR